MLQDIYTTLVFDAFALIIGDDFNVYPQGPNAYQITCNFKGRGYSAFVAVKHRHVYIQPYTGLLRLPATFHSFEFLRSKSRESPVNQKQAKELADKIKQNVRSRKYQS